MGSAGVKGAEPPSRDATAERCSAGEGIRTLVDARSQDFLISSPIKWDQYLNTALQFLSPARLTSSATPA